VGPGVRRGVQPGADDTAEWDGFLILGKYSKIDGPNVVPALTESSPGRKSDRLGADSQGLGKVIPASGRYHQYRNTALGQFRQMAMDCAIAPEDQRGIWAVLVFEVVLYRHDGSRVSKRFDGVQTNIRVKEGGGDH